MQFNKVLALRPKCMMLSTSDTDLVVFAEHKGRIIIYTTGVLQYRRYFLISKQHGFHASSHPSLPHQSQAV